MNCNILKGLIGHEVTVNKETAYLDKYRLKSYELNYSEIMSLIFYDYLELESGNFENGDEHYILNTYILDTYINQDITFDISELVSVIRDITISTILS